MQRQLNSYVKNKFKGKAIGTARLGFSTEKELSNIFKKTFGEALFNCTGTPDYSSSKDNAKYSFISARRLMGDLWATFQLFRNVKDEQYQGHISKCFKHNPEETMSAFFALKVILAIRGKMLCCSIKSAPADFKLHKAVFEGNLPFVSRLINQQQEGVIF